MSAKYTGNYTSEASKIIKRSERLECQTTEDGTCYICNGFSLADSRNAVQPFRN